MSDTEVRPEHQQVGAEPDQGDLVPPLHLPDDRTNERVNGSLGRPLVKASLATDHLDEL